MKVVVLAGGTSSERDVSLSTGTMIYRALKSKGHQAVLLDVYLGYEGDITNIFDKDTDWTSGIGSVGEDHPDINQIKSLRISVSNLTLYFLPSMVRTVRTERFRLPLIC